MLLVLPILHIEELRSEMSSDLSRLTQLARDRLAQHSIPGILKPGPASSCKTTAAPQVPDCPGCSSGHQEGLRGSVLVPLSAKRPESQSGE